MKTLANKTIYTPKIVQPSTAFTFAGLGFYLVVYFYYYLISVNYVKSINCISKTENLDNNVRFRWFTVFENIKMFWLPVSKGIKAR